MKQKIVFFTLSLFVLFVLSNNLVLTSTNSPPTANTGAPGDGLCTGCHSGTANSGPAEVTIKMTDGVNPVSSYTPGTTYSIVLSISESGRSKFGFELLALQNSDNTNIGSFIITDVTRTSALPGGGQKKYVGHTATGTAQVSTGFNLWSIDWTAPSSDVGDVTFYAAFNATNSNSGTSGDNIYNTSLKVTAATVLMPVADFSNSRDTTCIAGSISFTNTSANALTYLWDFGDGSTSTDFEPTHAYIQAGTYTVKLTATSGGTSDSKESVNLITVMSELSATSVSDTTICVGGMANLGVSLTGGIQTSATIIWTPAVGLSSATSMNPVAMPTSTTTYVAVISDGCSPDVQKSIKVSVSEYPTAPLLNCGTSTTSSIEFTWSEVMGASGYEISIDGGSNWTTPSSGATGLLHEVTGLSSGDSSSISVRGIGNGVCATGAMATLTCKAINCTPLQIVARNDTSVCKGDTVEMKIISVTGGSGGYSYEWLKNGSATTWGNKADGIFASVGADWICSVKVTDTLNPDCGATSVSFNISVYNQPIDLSYTLAGDSVKFLADSIIGSTFNWDFGDGSNSSGTPSVYHNYMSEGNYVVCVSGNTMDGCTYQNCDTVQVVITENSNSLSANQFSLFPNPAKDKFKVLVNNQNILLKGRLQIVNLLGQVQHSEFIDFRNGLSTEINTQFLSTGIYYVILKPTTEGQSIVIGKVLIQ